MVHSNLQGSRKAKQGTSVAPQGKPEQDPVQNGKRSEMEIETGYPRETEAVPGQAGKGFEKFSWH